MSLKISQTYASYIYFITVQVNEAESVMTTLVTYPKVKMAHVSA